MLKIIQIKNEWTKTAKRTHYKAFTLAEVLITLSIIGVVATMTVPTLLTNKAKQETVAKLQKEYTTLAQAVKLSEQDNGPNSTWDWSSNGSNIANKNLFDVYLNPYLKITKYCGSTPTDCNYTQNFYSCRNGTQSGCGASLWHPSGTSLVSADGTILYIRYDTKMIFVDINGAKNPNMYGKDVFTFILDPIKGLMPCGYDQGQGINDSCQANSDGKYCFAKIMNDSWQIKDDYPW